MVVVLALLLVSWYLLGVFGTLWIGRRLDSKKTTVKDLLFALTIGGIAGLLTWMVGFFYLPIIKWSEKELF